MNVHDSEKMAGILLEEGYSLTNDSSEADLVIFNTCSIRQKAEHKFLSELGRLKSAKKRNPALKVAVAGCIAQQLGKDMFSRSPYVDYVLGPQNLHMLKEMVHDRRNIAVEENPGLSRMNIPTLRADSTRAWVSIMFGCNNFCSYCIVPYTRGRETSRPAEEVVAEIESLAKGGCKEVTLLGQNVNSYSGDTDFPGLLEMITRVEGIRRIRFVTSHPRDFSVRLMETMSSLENVCEHIHLPLQSGSDRVLKAMNRGYTIEEYAQKVRRLRELVPGVAITTDIIAGFPNESDEDHGATLEALREIRFDGIFAFRYSSRPGTAASRIDDKLSEETRLERLKEILSLQDEITIEINKSLEGTAQEVLVEGRSETDKDRLTGRTRTNKIVNFHGNDEMADNIVEIRILRAMRHSLEGEPQG